MLTITGGCCPVASISSAVCATIAFISAAPSTVEDAATGAVNPSSDRMASPTGTRLSTVRSTTSTSFLPEE